MWQVRRDTIDGGNEAGKHRVDNRRPLLLYDGACAFCRRQARRLETVTRGDVAIAPYQEAAGAFPQIPPEEFEKRVYLIDAAGRVYAGAHAVYKALATRRSRRASLWCYEHVPGFAAVAEWGYRFVARHRGRFAWLPWL